MSGAARIFLLAVASLVIACAPSPNRTPETQAVADRIHAYVMKPNRDYVLTSSIKALAVCVKWPSKPSDPIFVDTAGAAIVADQSDVQFSAGPIMSSAMRQCGGARASGQYDCSCQMLDVAGSNTLEVPATITSADHPIRSRRPKIPR